MGIITDISTINLLDSSDHTSLQSATNHMGGSCNPQRGNITPTAEGDERLARGKGDQTGTRSQNKGSTMETLHLSCVLGNCRGGIKSTKKYNTEQEITTIASNLGVDLIALTEVGLPGVQIPLDGYKAAGVAYQESQDRQSHSGVGLWRKDTLRPIGITSVNNINGFQAINVKFERFGIVVFYRSPNKQSEIDIRKTIEYFQTVTDPDYIICGDLNIREAVWNKNHGSVNAENEDEQNSADDLMDVKQELVDELLNNLRSQYVRQPTRIDPKSGTESLLDVVLGGEHLQIECSITKTKPSKSDHEWEHFRFRLEPSTNEDNPQIGDNDCYKTDTDYKKAKED